MFNLLRNPLSFILSWFLIGTGLVLRYVRKSMAPNRITSIYVHDPSARLLEGCIKWLLDNKYYFISVAELYDILTSGRNIRPGAVCLTIDDGGKDTLLNVVPVIEKYGVPTCFFISAGPVEKGVFWWTYVEKSRAMGVNGVPDVDAFKAMPEAERSAAVGKLEKVLCVEREAMTQEEVFKISTNPLITIGSHTVNHAYMDRCSKEELLLEIKESKRLLSEWTNREISSFSYPDGNTTGEEHEILCESGYLMAFTTKPDLIEIDNYHPFYLPRFCMNERGPFVENICRICGAWQSIVGRIRKS